MKLDHRRTILVGLAFLSICAFWQMYDSVIPKILTETFHLNETLSGAIMALDNILALFLLPLFGALSDRTSTKIGRRMPFILLGTACAAVLMNLLPVLDNRYAAAPSTGKLVGFAAVLGLLLVAMGLSMMNLGFASATSVITAEIVTIATLKIGRNPPIAPAIMSAMILTVTVHSPAAFLTGIIKRITPIADGMINIAFSLPLFSIFFLLLLLNI